jgi:hypothetical protein
MTNNNLIFRSAVLRQKVVGTWRLGRTTSNPAKTSQFNRVVSSPVRSWSDEK